MKKIISIFISILFLFACAQQNQPLGGGPKDSLPPQLIKSFPKYNDTSFSEKEIIFKFDEFFSLNNIDQEFFSSPPFKEKPDFKISGKKLILKLNEQLKDSVTYFLNFGNSIIDYHEKNELKNFNLFFSTYNQIDTLQLSGKVVDAYNHKPIFGAFVMLYDKNIDSIPFLESPIYLTKTDSSGIFTIKNIKQKSYKIFVLEDKNKNYIYNEDENNIAFSDSLYKPWVETKIQFDTLDSGTVYINPNNLNPKDTLRNDTIIKKIIYNYYPNNIDLLFFTEENAKQEIKRKARTFKGLVKLNFLKPLIDNYVFISPLNVSDTKYFKYYKEEFPSKDSIYLWFTNYNFLKKDSLNFLIKYKINDSLFKTDSIIVTDYNYSTDTLPFLITSKKENISIFDNFKINTEALVYSFDSSKINLYQIVDTIVEDEKNQKIKVIRPELDSLIFTFDRPIIKNFNIIFDNYNSDNSPFLWYKNTIGDSVFCKINAHELLIKDTLNIKVLYDNLYFFNQIQLLSKKLKVPVTEQKIKTIKRLRQDSIILTFNKNISQNQNIEIINFPRTDYSYKIINNKLEIILNNNKAINQDTLSIVFSFFDRKLYNGLNKYYNDTIKAIYTFDVQKIGYTRRFMRSKMIIAFKKPLLALPELELLSFNPLRKWYNLKLNNSKDTVFVNINNQRVIRLNNMKLRISYFDINQHNDTLYFADTLNIKTEKLKKESSTILGREKKLSIKKPIDFNIKRDSLKMREYEIQAEYLSGANYKLEIDSAAFKDIFKRSNDSLFFNFKVFSPNEFASLSIEIKNIWSVLDNYSEIDTSTFYQLPIGEIILLIESEDGNIYKRVNINSDKVISSAMFLPGKYYLRIIYDKNENKIWDTGNYLEHRQPEKIYIYNQTINLEQGDSKKIIWDLSSEL